MTTHDVGSSREESAVRLGFDRYVLDLDRGCLLLEGNEIALRPKTFAVLHHLVENCGRLVSKDELFGAVWPDVAVTDDALVQSVGELRRALGDDGPRLIRTIPRRGYRFEAAVTHVAASGQSTPRYIAALNDIETHEPVTEAPDPPTQFASTQTGRRIGSIAVLLVVAILATAVVTEWRFSSIRGHADRSMARSAEAGMKPTIAIIPFTNRSDDSTQEYFSDGLTQDIINTLGRFSELTVMSWNAVLPYRTRPASPGEIARDLAIRYQVEGSVSQTGDRVRVITQLVDSNGRVLWSARFDEALADLFNLQDEITTQIVRALAIQVTQIEQRRVFAKPTANLEAYDYVLRARPALQRPTRANVAEARTLLKQAIRLDPNYAAAYAALGDTYHLAASIGWAESPTESLSRAEDMADKALSIAGISSLMTRH